MVVEGRASRSGTSVIPARREVDLDAIGEKARGISELAWSCLSFPVAVSFVKNGKTVGYGICASGWVTVPLAPRIYAPNHIVSLFSRKKSLQIECASNLSSEERRRGSLPGESVRIVGLIVGHCGLRRGGW